MVRIDMDMPAKCMECIFAAHDVFGFTGACNAVRDSSRLIGFDSANRPDWCPLKPIVACIVCEYYERCTDDSGEGWCENPSSMNCDHLVRDNGFCGDGELSNENWPN